MATFFIPKDEPVEIPVFNKDTLMEEFKQWVESQSVWAPIYSSDQIWDVLLVRSLTCTIAYTASPLFNPHESTKTAQYQQVIAIKICGRDEDVDTSECSKINQWSSSFILTDNMDGIHRNLDKLAGE